MKETLTPRQNQTFDFIRSYMLKNHKPPTLKEIGMKLNIRSSSSVFKLVHALEKKGYVKREKHSARGLSLVDVDHDPYSHSENLLAISRTPSHEPEKLREDPISFFSVDQRILKTAGNIKACIIGRAGDDAMNGDGIRKGDFLIIEEMPWQKVRNGDIAAFLVREELLVRRFSMANGRIHLHPADRMYDEENFLPNDPACHVIGCVVGLMRRL